MNVQINDILTLKKKHPCGSDRWKALRVGMDFRLKCMGCGHEILVARNKIEKSIKAIEQENKNI